MAAKLENLGSEAFQVHTIVFEESEIQIELFFGSVVQRWFMDVVYNDFSTSGIAVSLGTGHIKELNQPFDFVCKDNSGLGIDPFQIDDFSSGRCELFMLDREEMFTIRGFEVPA